MKFKSLARDICDYILSLFYPKRCIFCEEIVDPFSHICSDCNKHLPKIEGEVCKLCGALKSDCVCKGRHGNYYDGVVAPLYYEDNVKNCIHRFKFYDERLNCEGLGDMMCQALKRYYSDIEFDFITYIPTRNKNLKKRGYNQSRLLAERVSENSGIPFGEEMLVKIYDTPYQRGITELERKGNVAGVFDVNIERYDVNNKNILLIDDVKTTGTTLSECGKMLYLAGANKVYCLTAAVVNSKMIKEKDKEA